jgi:hypothetical protein
MTDRLDSARRKLRRASDHFETLEVILSQLPQDNPHLASKEYNHDAGRYEFAFQDDWTLDPDLPLIVGDILHNARACLDHVAWALAKNPNRDTGFPILLLEPATKFRKSSKLRSMKPSAKAKIESVQPYKRTQHADPLWRLSELDITDKHHLLLSTTHHRPGAGWYGTALDHYVLDSPPVDVKRGAVFMHAAGPFDPEMQVDIKPTVDVVILDAPVTGYLLDWTLRSILEDIENNVLPAFRPSDFW